MKKHNQLALLFFILLLLSTFSQVTFSQQKLTAREIIKTAEEKLQGEKTSIGTMSMEIVRPSWTRTVQFKIWTKGKDYSLTLITAPAKEKGQAFLKRENEMWNWNPRISRMIKLPPSMMSQGWMGSDYTNDDILKESSLISDYTHELLGEEEVEGRLCYKIKMTVNEGVNVVWGSQIRWIDKEYLIFIKNELYDEEGYLVRTELGKNIKEMDGRMIPSRMEIIPADEEGKKTILTIEEIKFNKNIDDQFFSQQNMKRLH